MQAASITRGRIATIAARGVAYAPRTCRQVTTFVGVGSWRPAPEACGAGFGTANRPLRLGSTIAGAGISRWMSGKKEKGHRSEGGAAPKDKTKALMEELGLHSNNKGKGGGGGGAGKASKSAGSAGTKSKASKALSSKAPKLSRVAKLHAALMDAAAKAKGVLKPVPDKPRRGNWALVDPDEPWLDDMQEQMEAQGVVMLESKSPGGEVVTVITSLCTLRRLDDQDDDDMGFNSRAYSDDDVGEPGDERFDSLNELSNLHAIALVCVHRPTQQHPLVMECSLSLPMGLLIDRAVIGSAGLNELAMKETRFFGFIYDRHRSNTMEVPESEHGQEGAASVQCLLDSPLEERTQFHERFESMLQERFTMPDSGMDEAEDEGTIGFILQRLQAMEARSHTSFFERTGNFFDGQDQ